MLKILIAKISLISLKSNINPFSKHILILNISKDYFTITNGKGIRPILGIKDPLYIKQTNNEIVIKDKKKNIDYKIIIHEIFNTMESDIQLSNFSKSLHKQEEDLKKDIVNNFSKYFPNSKVIDLEYETPYGNIDILAINNKGEYEIIELKKRSTDLNTIDQVCKYGKYFEEHNKIHNLYILGIKDNLKNKKYALDNNVTIIKNI